MDHFVFGSNTWLEKWQLSHGLAVDGAYFLGFSTFLSEKCNGHTVSLWGRAYSLGFGTLEAGILATVVLLPIGLSENYFSVSSVQERLVLLASQLLPSTLVGSNNVQVARLVMGCHDSKPSSSGVGNCLQSSVSKFSYCVQMCVCILRFQSVLASVFADSNCALLLSSMSYDRKMNSVFTCIF